MVDVFHEDEFEITPDVAVGTLVRDLLGIDAASLATMAQTHDVMNGEAMYGLQAFLRRILELAVQVRDRDELTLFLKDEASAMAHGFPSARLANLAVILVSSIIRDERWIKNLPFAVIEKAPGIDADPVIVIDQSLREMPLDQLIAKFKELPGLSRRERGKTFLEPRFPVSVTEIVRSEFELEPALLTRGHAGTEAQTESAFTGKPEVRALAGMRALFWSALSKYRTMRRRDTTRIRLMSDADAEVASEPSTRVAHLTTLFAGALHADRRHDVRFLPVRPRTDEENAALRSVAKVVYSNFTVEAMDGLELICDANIHFRWPDRSLAHRLLCSVAAELPDVPKPDVVETHEFAVQAAVGLAGGDIREHLPSCGPLQ